MVNPELFDFLTANATTHVGRDTGERIATEGPLPEYEGTYFIPGTASFGALHKVGSLPGEPTREISPDHRWVGIWEEDAFVLYDTRAGGDRGFSFHPPSADRRPHTIAIHPSGELLGFYNRDGIAILLPDGKTLTHREFRTSEHGYPMVQFSGCGNYLWFPYAPEEGADCLLLLSVPRLEELDRIPVPRVPKIEDHLDKGAFWGGPTIRPLPDPDCLMIARERGEWVAVITFHQATARGKISTHTNHFSAATSTGTRYPENLYAIICSSDGTQFAAGDARCGIYQWSWPSCQLTHYTHLLEVSLWWHDNPEFDYLAYNGDYLLFEYCDISILDRTNLEFLGLLPRKQKGSFLDNGLLHLPDGDRRGMFLLREPTEQKPAVLEIEGRGGDIRHVYCRDGGGWRDQIEELSWVLPNFRLAHEYDEFWLGRSPLSE